MFDLHAACMTLHVAAGLFVHCSLARSPRWKRPPWYQPQSFEPVLRSKRMPLRKCTFVPAALAFQCSAFARLGLYWCQPQSFEPGFQSKRMPLWKCTFGPATLAFQCSEAVLNAAWCLHNVARPHPKSIRGERKYSKRLGSGPVIRVGIERICLPFLPRELRRHKSGILRRLSTSSDGRS